MRSPFSTVNAAWVRRSRPSRSTGVRNDTASGPAMPTSDAVEASHPRHDRPVVETEGELHSHLDGAPDALDDPDDVRRLAAGRHEVDQAGSPGGGLELGLEHERVAAIRAASGT